MNHLHLNPFHGSSMPSRAVNLNDLVANSPRIWSRRMQDIHNKKANFRQTANFEERSNLSVGKDVQRNKKSRLSVQDYIKQNSFTTQDVTATPETLTINKAKVVPFFVDDIDDVQNKYKAKTEWADESAKKLTSEIDADYMSEYASAKSTVDDSDVTGGTLGNGVTPSISNILKIFAIAGRKLDDRNIEQGKRFANISPFMHQIIVEHLAGKDSALGDKSSLGGHEGMFMGFNLFKSTNLSSSATLGLATQPTDGDPVEINGVIFTFKTALTPLAGEVLIGASAATANTNLAALINAPSVTTAQGVMLDGTAPTDQDPSDQERFRRITATANAASTDIVAKGVGNLVLSETLTAGADGWTVGLELQHNLFGRMGAIDVVIQKAINVKFKDVPDKLGENIVSWMLYGINTFNEGAEALVDVKTDTKSLTSFPL